ncbi:hypothetical protein RMB03_17390 [Acinetobacter sp. V91_7]|uniref:hypothetical protein n=1 Tax=unclassified Acinetobacter TaxID=196816 RepID=UPI00287CE366|nr:MULTISPECIES: hypothetical protein [unclassified Acinetobacter]MDS7935669.1 hypothetical protein [Acinetobacter sp. V91_4B]MDS7964723.1 hypothetical protein [Acinetobacter sp. V91_7]MDS8025582.1 hypothetical protein [Acinetobacter sp. V91_13]
MARKTKRVPIKTGRDKDKTFLVTEMSVTQADRWAMRAIFSLTKAGVDIEGLNASNGMLEMAKVATSAIQGLSTEEGMELLNELLECVQIIPKGGDAREVEWDDEVEEFTTLFTLRKEALFLHIDFLVQGNTQDSSDAG